MLPTAMIKRFIMIYREQLIGSVPALVMRTIASTYHGSKLLGGSGQPRET